MQWQVVTSKKYDDFVLATSRILDAVFGDANIGDAAVAGYRVCVYSQHRGCQCQRQLLLRAAHPFGRDQLPFGPLWDQEYLQRDLCEFLVRSRLPIPNPLPEVEFGYWWEDPETSDNIYQVWNLAIYNLPINVRLRE